MNDFLSSTRTFELKEQVAALISGHGYPMVLNVVLHRLNIDHVGEIMAMAERMGAEYVELANTQYYGWAWLNRAQLLPSRAQLERAEAVTRSFRERVGDRMQIFFVVPDYFETRPKPCMNGWGACSSRSRPTAPPCRATRRACCRASSFPTCAPTGCARSGTSPPPSTAFAVSTG